MSKAKFFNEAPIVQHHASFRNNIGQTKEWKWVKAKNLHFNCKDVQVRNADGTPKLETPGQNWQALKAMKEQLAQNRPCWAVYNSKRRKVLEIKADFTKKKGALQDAQVRLESSVEYDEANSKKTWHVDGPKLEADDSLEALQYRRDGVLKAKSNGKWCPEMEEEMITIDTGNNAAALQHYGKGMDEVKIPISNWSMVKHAREDVNKLTSQTCKRGDVVQQKGKSGKLAKWPSCDGPVPYELLVRKGSWSDRDGKWQGEKSDRRVLEVRENGTVLLLEAFQKVLNQGKFIMHFEKMKKVSYTVAQEYPLDEVFPCPGPSLPREYDSTKQRSSVRLFAKLRAERNGPLRKICRILEGMLLLEVPKRKGFKPNQIRINGENPRHRLDVKNGDAVTFLSEATNDWLDATVIRIADRGHTEQARISKDMYERLKSLERQPCGKQLQNAEQTAPELRHDENVVKFYLRGAAVGRAFSEKADPLLHEEMCPTYDHFWQLGVPSSQNDDADFITDYVCKENDLHYMKWHCPKNSATTKRYSVRVQRLIKLEARKRFGTRSATPNNLSWRKLTDADYSLTWSRPSPATSPSPVVDRRSGKTAVAVEEEDEKACREVEAEATSCITLDSTSETGTEAESDCEAEDEAESDSDIFATEHDNRTDCSVIDVSDGEDEEGQEALPDEDEEGQEALPVNMILVKDEDARPLTVEGIPIAEYWAAQDDAEQESRIIDARIDGLDWATFCERDRDQDLSRQAIKNDVGEAPSTQAAHNTTISKIANTARELSTASASTATRQRARKIATNELTKVPANAIRRHARPAAARAGDDATQN